MLEIGKATVALDEEELVELQRIITDGDGAKALRFLKRSIRDKIARAQSGRLKCHLDTGSESPAERFKAGR